MNLSITLLNTSINDGSKIENLSLNEGCGRLQSMQGKAQYSLMFSDENISTGSEAMGSSLMDGLILISSLLYRLSLL